MSLTQTVFHDGPVPTAPVMSEYHVILQPGMRLCVHRAEVVVWSDPELSDDARVRIRQHGHLLGPGATCDEPDKVRDYGPGEA